MNNFLKLFESELDKAEVTLATKNISDRLQKIASDISKIKVDDVPSLVERIKSSHGIETGNAFNESISTELDGLIDNILKVKSTVDDQSLVLSGDETNVSSTNDMDLDNDMEDDISELSDDDEPEEENDLDDKPSIEDELPPLGRRVKGKLKTESVNESASLLADMPLSIEGRIGIPNGYEYVFSDNKVTVNNKRIGFMSFLKDMMAKPAISVNSNVVTVNANKKTYNFSRRDNNKLHALLRHIYKNL